MDATGSSFVAFSTFRSGRNRFCGRRGWGNGREQKKQKEKETTEKKKRQLNGSAAAFCARPEKLFCTGHWPVKEKPKWLPVNNLFSIGSMLASVLMDSTSLDFFF